MAQVLELPPPMWETQMKCQAPGIRLVQLQSKPAEGKSLSVSFCLKRNYFDVDLKGRVTERRNGDLSSTVLLPKGYIARAELIQS